MNRLKYNASARGLNTAASLTLFLVFTLCMIMTIGAGAGVYSRVNNGYKDTYGSSAAIKYVSNKIRASDSCEIVENGKGLLLGMDSILCLIYFSTTEDEGAGIYEKSMSYTTEIPASGGEKIFDCGDFSITEMDGLYKISVSYSGETTDVLIRKGES